MLITTLSRLLAHDSPEAFLSHVLPEHSIPSVPGMIMHTDAMTSADLLICYTFRCRAGDKTRLAGYLKKSSSVNEHAFDAVLADAMTKADLVS